MKFDRLAETSEAKRPWIHGRGNESHGAKRAISTPIRLLAQHPAKDASVRRLRHFAVSPSGMV